MMDPISPGIISGLIVNAVTAIVSPIARRQRTHEQLIKQVEKDLTGQTPRYRMPLLVDLPSLKLSAIDENRFIKFLNTREATNFAHEVAVAVLVDEFDDAQEELVAQAHALLVLTGVLSKASARKLAGKYVANLTVTFNHCIELLSSTEVTELRRDARAQRSAGYLQAIAQRTLKLQRHSSRSLAEIYHFTELYRHLIHTATSEVMPAHMSEQKGVPLESLYVSPSLKINDGESARRIPLDQFTPMIYRDVVLGDPGAGKSTLAQKLIHDLTAPNHPSSLIPFLVTLRDFQNYKSQERNTIEQYIAVHVREQYQLPVPPGGIDYLLATGKAIVIFDGLDELIDTSKKREIRTVVEIFAELYATSPILITSRKIGYPEAPLKPTIFRSSELVAFSDSEVADYAEKWFNLEPSLTARERKTLSANFLDESETIPDLRKNPLMLSLLCNLYRGARSIPRDRADLYERCATMLFDRWDAQRGIIVRGPLRSDAREALQDIALWVFTNQHLADGIPHHILVQRLTTFYHPRRYESEIKAREVAEELLELWRGRAWVLTDCGTTPKGEALYGFSHQTFLEYFAAVELARQNPSPTSLWSTIEEHLKTAEWDIVAQVAIQNLNRSYHGAADQVIRLLLEVAQRGDLESHLNLLNFVTRYVDALNPSAQSTRMITSACVGLALLGQPAFRTLPRSNDYSNKEVYSSEREDSELVIYSDDLLVPLLYMLGAADELGAYAVDQLITTLTEVANDASDPVSAGKALILGLNLNELLRLADVDPQCVDDRIIDGRTILWTCDSVRKVLHTARRTNFWVPLEAARRGCISIAELVEAGQLDTLFISASSFEHRDAHPASIPVLAYKLLKKVIDSESIDNLSVEEVAALRATGRSFRQVVKAGSRKIDRTWINLSPFEDTVVQSTFLGARRQSYDDWPVHPLDRPIGRDRERRGVRRDEEPARLDPEAFFGAACLLAVVVEAERWNVLDYSDDQYSRLRLGLLKGMEPVYLFRLAQGVEYEVHDALAMLPLDSEDAAALESWAKHRVHLTS